MQTTCMLMCAGLKVWDEIKNHFIIKKEHIYLRLFTAELTIAYYLHHFSSMQYAVCTLCTVCRFALCIADDLLHAQCAVSHNAMHSNVIK